LWPRSSINTPKSVISPPSTNIARPHPRYISPVNTAANVSGRPGRIARFLAIGQRPGDDPDLRVRKRTGVVATLALILAGSVYTVVGITTDHPIVTVFSILQSGGQAAGLVYLARTGRLAPVVVNMMILGLLVILSGVVTLGGMLSSSGNLVWGLVTPIGAVLFLGRRAAIPAFLAYAAVVIASALISDRLLGPEIPVPEGTMIALYVVNLLGAGAVGLGLVVFIDGERIRAKASAEGLLLNVLPQSIVDRLHGGERVIADHCSDVSVLFADVVDFTPFAEAEPAERVVALLDELFSAFDGLAEEHGLEKIKTIGDAYMVVAGVPVERADNAQVMVRVGLAMHAVAAERGHAHGRPLRLRIGIATGPVVAGVIGRRKFSYDLWGDTVNTASRMESTGVPGCIQVTSETHARCAADYPWERRDGVEVKGKGPMQTYLLDPTRIPAAGAVRTA
jgi:adenylate cyclase